MSERECTPEIAIHNLRQMQKQIIHGKNTFGEIADLIVSLTAQLDKQQVLLDNANASSNELLKNLFNVKSDWEVCSSALKAYVETVGKLSHELKAKGERIVELEECLKQAYACGQQHFGPYSCTCGIEIQRLFKKITSKEGV